MKYEYLIYCKVNHFYRIFSLYLQLKLFTNKRINTLRSLYIISIIQFDIRGLLSVLTLFENNRQIIILIG